MKICWKQPLFLLDCHTLSPVINLIPCYHTFSSQYCLHITIYFLNPFYFQYHNPICTHSPHPTPLHYLLLHPHSHPCNYINAHTQTGLPDPFVKISICGGGSGTCHTTDTCRATLDPTWNQHYDL